MKRITIILILLQGIILHAQNNTSVSLDGDWQLSYGIYDRDNEVTPDELKSKDWPVIPAKVPGQRGA